MISKTWKPKTSGFGEHDFQFNVPPPSEKNALAHADGPRKITPDRMIQRFKFLTAKNLERKRFISSSSAGGRWDRWVLIRKSEDGNPHTSELRGLWKGWDKTMRTISHTTKNSILYFERDYSSLSLIGLPPPL